MADIKKLRDVFFAQQFIDCDVKSSVTFIHVFDRWAVRQPKGYTIEDENEQQELYKQLVKEENKYFDSL